eukprot:scaffold982_cov139-Cylindrotheca_fusiformis.AAC.15
MATHDLHFAVSTNGVEDNTFHDDPSVPETPPGQNASWGRLSQSSHPIVMIFHILFKGAAFFFYLFGGFLTKNKYGGKSGAKFIVVTVICILLLAADFWVVKNVTGRLLVGLRWWNRVDGDSTRWIFESAKDRQVNKFDSSMFWTVLYATPTAWVVLSFFAIVRLNFGWLIICGTGLALSGANVYGYYKCSSEQKARFEQIMHDGAQAGAMAMFKNSASSLNNSVLGFVTRAAAGSGGQEQQNQQPPPGSFV